MPQVPGTMPRSWRVRGGAETFLKTKRYIAPMVVVQPALGLAVLYLDHGRWQLGRADKAVGGVEVDRLEVFKQRVETLVANR